MICLCTCVLICWMKTRNNFLSTKQEVEKLMNRVRSADQDQKPPGQWTMEGYLYVQEKRECYNRSDSKNERTEGQTVYGIPYQTLSNIYSDTSRIWFSCVFILSSWSDLNLVLSCVFPVPSCCRGNARMKLLSTCKQLDYILRIRL